MKRPLSFYFSVFQFLFIIPLLLFCCFEETEKKIKEEKEIKYTNIKIAYFGILRNFNICFISFSILCPFTKHRKYKSERT